MSGSHSVMSGMVGVTQVTAAKGRKGRLATTSVRTGGRDEHVLPARWEGLSNQVGEHLLSMVLKRGLEKV